MSTSRKHTHRPHAPHDLSREPHVRRMLRADEAERRGDAAGALDQMLAAPDPHGGASYWRPERINRLAQLTILDDALPAWARSRWLLEQSLQDLDRSRRDHQLEALSIAIEIGGGVGAVAPPRGEDPRVKIIDHDWVYRQCLAYELGGLAHFVQRRADAGLVTRADRVRAWSRSAMGGYRFVDRRPATTTWVELATGEEIEIANIGSAVLLVPGDCAIGRLVPIEGGRMFETVPLRVAEPVARAVADDPPGWLDALRAARDGEEPPVTGGVRFGFLTDVPRAVSMLTTYDVPRPDAPESVRVRELLRNAARALGGDVPDDPEEIDIWPCLATELLAPDVLAGLAEPGTSPEGHALADLGTVLAEPAASVCADLASRRAA